MPAELHVDPDTWVQAFVRAEGRRPRVLHIGNVANNAYLNAKILRRAGIECDVLSYDYYHIMGTPEWEDADLAQAVVDENHPQWHTIDLKGFQCPPWFAQGPFATAVAYLRARHEGDPNAAALWHCLQVAARRQPGLDGPGTSLARRMLTQANRLAVRVVRGGYRRSRRLVRKLFFHTPFSTRVAELCAEFRAHFPARQDAMRPVDFWRLELIFPAITALIAQYDLIAGYATDGIFALLAANIPYIAFEHGTLRNIPFQANAQGRMCALTYRLADEVLITNADNQVAAERLGLPRYRFVAHAVNEDLDHTERAAALRQELRERLRANFLAFHPARQHWDAQRHPDWEKGNDHFIRGFAHYVRTCNANAGAVFVEWGQRVAQSKELIQSLGIADRVLWIRPQPNQSLAHYIRAADAVADQFHLGAFGNIMPKALFMGTPSLLYVDESRHRWCFADMPPVLNVRTPEAIADALRQLTTQPALAESLRVRGRDWYDRYHSNRAIARTWIAAFADARNRARARPPGSAAGARLAG